MQPFKGLVSVGRELSGSREQKASEQLEVASKGNKTRCVWTLPKPGARLHMYISALLGFSLGQNSSGAPKTHSHPQTRDLSECTGLKP